MITLGIIAAATYFFLESKTNAGLMLSMLAMVGFLLGVNK